MMEKKVLKTIRKYNLIQNGDKIVVGVSGGPDSICLLNVLYNLRSAKNVNFIKQGLNKQDKENIEQSLNLQDEDNIKQGLNVQDKNNIKQTSKERSNQCLDFEIYVAHINHMIRKEADEETAYVEAFCKKLGIECFTQKINVTEKSQIEKIGTEEAGRKARYDFFEEVLRKVGANKIATAHNANDNAETVLMNLLRGTGTSGLKGITPIRDSKFIRPLIECERVEIEEYCENNKLEPKIDMSNFENIYTRNKIRNILIPQIKKEFNPNIISSLNRLSDLAKQENEFLQKYSQKILNEDLIVSYNRVENSLVLDLKKFNQLEYVIKSRVLLESIKMALGNVQGIEKIHIDDIIELCSKNVGNKYLTPNKNVKVGVKGGKIFVKNMKEEGSKI